VKYRNLESDKIILLQVISKTVYVARLVLFHTEGRAGIVNFTALHQ